MAISDDLLECRLRFIEIGHRAIKPAQARIGIRYHPCIARNRRQSMGRSRGGLTSSGIFRPMDKFISSTLS
jgi:hypothetical protein